MKQVIVISDPANGVSYTLDPQKHAAIKRDFHVMKMKVATARDEEKIKLEGEKKLAALQTPPNSFSPKKRRPPAKSLGRQVIEGVEAEGTRTTITIPAGQIGNDLPINIVSEQWYSPEPQLLVMTKHGDPRTGETT